MEPIRLKSHGRDGNVPRARLPHGNRLKLDRGVHIDWINEEFTREKVAYLGSLIQLDFAISSWSQPARRPSPVDSLLPIPPPYPRQKHPL